MSGYETIKVKYNDPYDVGKMDSREEEYYLRYCGTSDVISFYRDEKIIACLSKGDAWLLMKALEDMMKNEEPHLFNKINPFETAQD